MLFLSFLFNYLHGTFILLFHNHCAIFLYDTGLFSRYIRYITAKDGHMVVAYLCNNGTLRCADCIRRVKPAAKPRLNNHIIALLLLKVQKSHSKAVVKHRKPYAKIYIKQIVSKPCDILLRYHMPVNRDALLKIHQMR